LGTGIYPLQKGPFQAILRQKAAAGVSLAAAFLLVLQRKSLFLKCFAVLRPRFFLAANSVDAAILIVLQGHGGSGREKDGCKTESIPMTNRLKGAGFLYKENPVAIAATGFILGTPEGTRTPVG